MKLNKLTLSVSALALTLGLSAALASNQLSEPAYNPATLVNLFGVVTDVHQAPTGSPLAGSHLTVKTKTQVFDVYLAPADFLKFLKTNFTAGEEIQVIGSKVQVNGADVILSQQVDDGYETITLRDVDGAAAWQSWGREIDPSQVR